MSVDTGAYATTLGELGVLVAGRAPGHVLQTGQLERQFGVSRTVIREVVRVLESMGMVQSRRRVGVVVNPLDQWNLFDPQVIQWRLDSPARARQLLSLTEFRMGFEPAAAALAAERATPAQCGVLVGAVMDMAVHGRAAGLDGRPAHPEATADNQPADLMAYLQADIVFHTTLLAATDNEMFTALHPVVARALDGRTRHGLMPPVPNPQSIRLHADVAQAVQAGDRDAAERAMRAVIAEADDAMRERINREAMGSQQC